MAPAGLYSRAESQRRNRNWMIPIAQAPVGLPDFCVEIRPGSNAFGAITTLCGFPIQLLLRWTLQECLLKEKHVAISIYSIRECACKHRVLNHFSFRIEGVILKRGEIWRKKLSTDKLENIVQKLWVRIKWQRAAFPLLRFNSQNNATHILLISLVKMNGSLIFSPSWMHGHITNHCATW